LTIPRPPGIERKLFNDLLCRQSIAELQRRWLMPRFSEINFKYTDAEEERLHAPELIDQAYVDIDGILQRIQSPEKFLVIGPKGSGKTALSSKLQMMEKNRWDLFVDNDILEQFEFQLLDKTGGEKGTSIGGALTAWQLILSLRLMPLLLKDERFRELNPKIVKFNDSLAKCGLSASNSLISIVQYISRRGVFSKLKCAIAEVSGEQKEEESFKIKDPAALLNSMKSVFEDTKPSQSRYFLLLDGLDYILRRGRNNAPYIADLVNAVRQINIFFNDHDIDAKVIILIRNEVLKIIPDPNLTKRVNDNGVLLRWYDNTRSPFDTSLLKVIEKRASLCGFRGSIKTLWNEWFPKSINNSGSFDFVIINTRFLPRDLISFFRELQALGKEPPFNRVDVLSALNNYSDWFLEELSDALTGLIDENIRLAIPDFLSELGREFALQDLKTKLSEYGLQSESSTEQLARELFNASWIGNVWKTDKDTPRFSWKHRKINAKLNLKHKIIVHCGLWKTLNLI
jgi:hypothetical protein